MIRLINQDIKKIEVRGTFCLAHEHLDFDLRPVRGDQTSYGKSLQTITKELQPAVKQGLGLVVDLSNQSMLPNKQQLLLIAKQLNLQIVTATGYYLNQYEKKNAKSVSELEREFMSDLTTGFYKTGVRAGIIGEIATSSRQIYPFERKVFKAAVNVQKLLNVPLYTHCNLGNQVKNQIKLLQKLGAQPGKTIIGHLEFASQSDLFYALKRGFNVGIDTIGKQNYMSDAKRVSIIKKIIARGYEDQLVLSLDISSRNYLQAKGGHGYGYLYGGFWTLIKNQISALQWQKITRTNIIRILDF